MYLLDTNHCSRIIFGDSNLIQQLQLNSEAGIATSVVVCGELLYMAAKSDRSVANLQQVRVFLDTIDIYPVNFSISEVYGNLKGKLVNALGLKKKPSDEISTCKPLVLEIMTSGSQPQQFTIISL